jgi:hypothetical protein
MFARANRGRKEGEPITIGDLVLLKREGINFAAYEGTENKQRPKLLGPYKVLETRGESHFKILLPATLHRLNPVFHRERLFKYQDPFEEFPSRTRRHHNPPPEELGEWEVEEIIDKRKNHRRVEYLVRWKGYSSDECTWEPSINLGNAKEAVGDFEKRLQSRGDVRSAKIEVFEKFHENAGGAEGL